MRGIKKLLVTVVLLSFGLFSTVLAQQPEGNQLVINITTTDNHLIRGSISSQTGNDTTFLVLVHGRNFLKKIHTNGKFELLKVPQGEYLVTVIQGNNLKSTRINVP